MVGIWMIQNSAALSHAWVLWWCTQYAVPVEVGGEVCSRLNPWAKWEQVVLLLHRRARADRAREL